MNNIPDIINSQIVSSRWDVFWDNISNNINELPARPVLVVSAPFTANSAEETQLRKMLQACQLTDDQYNIIQLTGDQPTAWHLLRDKLQIKTILLLGITPDLLGVSVQLMPHQVSRFNDCNWIQTISLEQLIQYADIKNHLWNYGLKPVFIEKVYG